ncbi:hypothetical protein H257_02870 [Aphanomyces astaci]|uniref:Uncharacterized protein n=1 Tax=Aphanomyces astaci TaxID=112090 RepID=W4GZ93_APHAT|nr:hypothetical protein H257_02870 [Aphanomyces astaci]ETV84977.1 hypothetical protein H257_02870 [Aphanomyces astaci]|eukprot:XP_009824995.1 hypothetical protein H257_02870 [Aphanomyces astaci]
MDVMYLMAPREFLERVDTTLGRLDEALDKMQRHADDLGKPKPQHQHQHPSSTSFIPFASNTSQTSPAATTSSTTTQPAATTTSRSSDKRHSDTRSMNPRAVPDTWVSLAKQRTQAPPPPPKPPTPNPPRRKAPSSALAAPTILSDVPDLHFAWQDGSFR